MDALNLKIGLYDDPEKQTQENYTLDLYRDNFAIFGSTMSGKTTLIKTLLLRIHQVYGLSDKEEIYILDFGTNLGEFDQLPYVVACFDATHEENVRRIFKKIEDRLSDNIKVLKARSYLQCEEKERPSHVTFIIDGLNAFFGEDRYTAYHDSLQRIARDGLSKGVSVIFTANEPTGGVHRLLPSFKRIVALELPKDTYSDVFGHRVEKPMSIKGRGMANTEEGIYEFQAYFPYNANAPSCSDRSAIDAIIQEILTRYNITEESVKYVATRKNYDILKSCYDKKMKYFIDDLTKSNWKDYTLTTWEDYRSSSKCKKTDLIAGLDYYTLEPVKINLEQTRAIAIYGKKSFGKTNLLSLIIEVALNIPNAQFVILEDGRLGVTDPQKACAVTNILSRVNRNQIVVLYSCDDFLEFLKHDGYYDVPDSMGPRDIDFYDYEDKAESEQFRFKKIEHPFTVFIIQSRLFYQKTAGGDNIQIIPRIDQFVSNESFTEKKLFVFSDVQRIHDDINATIFNNWIDHAFLLDDVVRFISSPRGQKSVFGSQDIDELKEMFGKCELGDGFYLNLELVELSKLRFIKQEETGNG